MESNCISRSDRSSKANAFQPTMPFIKVFMGLTSALLSIQLFASDLSEVEPYHEPKAEHCDQLALLEITDPEERFETAFECGDELFATHMNMLDGAGANVGDHLRFSRLPRADKNGPGEWASHFPKRSTGPNAEACTVCHGEPFEDGSGGAGLNAIRDPLHSGDPSQFIQRNTPHLFGSGALQRLAEEMTIELQTAVATARDQSCAQAGGSITIPLITKQVSFGSITVRCDGQDDLSSLEGIDEDLIVKAYQWKGNTSTLRQFNRDASHDEVGMQAVELVGYDVDGDGDGVSNELSVGDITALSVYLGGQPRPVTKLELNRLGLLPLSRNEIRNIRNGEAVFEQVGCDSCHRPTMMLNNPEFTEPSQTAAFSETTFPAGQSTVVEGVDPLNPIRIDLTRDILDNRIEINGQPVHFGNFEKTPQGEAIVRLYSDLKRHEMGEELAENIDETGTGASVWKTQPLWGVGSTSPYLHDGRATTLTEAILAHGGEAQSVRNAAAKLSQTDFSNLIAFLDNLVLYKVTETESSADSSQPRHRFRNHRH